MGGRLSKEEIEKMVNDAEKYKAEDDQQKERISAKNNLESYCFNMKSTLEDEKLKDKISEADHKTINDKCDGLLSGWTSIRLLTKMSMLTNRRRFKEFAIQSSLSCISKQEVLQGECQERECLEQEQEDLSQELQVQVVLLDKDQLLKRWTKHFMSW